MPKARTIPSRARPTRAATAKAKAGAASVHRQTRRAHSLETAEDYAELVADLIDREGEARVVDLARELGVSHVTVIRTVARLQRDGWLTSKPYRSIFLTDAGRELAGRCKERHLLVLEFLRAIGVSERTAQVDAEGIEHHASDETLRAFARVVQNSRR